MIAQEKNGPAAAPELDRYCMADAVKAVTAFVEVLFEPGDIVEIRKLPARVSTWHKAEEVGRQVATLWEQNANRINIYIGANPRKCRGAKDNDGVACVRTLFADLDHVTVDEASRRVETSGLPAPTMVINSGHGVHLYWRLSEPMSDLEAWREHQKHLIGALNSDKSIHDPARIMRLPGFMNLKAPAARCSIVECDPTRVYAPSAVRAVPSSPPAVSPQVTSAPTKVIPEGERNDSLFKLAAALRGRGAGDADIRTALAEENEKKCLPPLPSEEVTQIARSAMRYKPNATARPAAEEEVEEEVEEGRDLLAAMPEQVRAEAESMLSDPKIIDRIESDIALLGVAGEQPLAMTVYLIGTSRLLSRPLAGIVQGTSSSGKSFIIEAVARLFPPEGILLAQQLTPQALIHMRPGSLCNRFIVAGERSRREDDDAAEATRALREMISSGRLSKLMPEKGPGGRIVTKRIEQMGPIAYIESTTQGRIFEEDLNRCILLATDEQKEQTRRILKSTAQSLTCPNRDIDGVVQRHHALQRHLALEAASVAIPYADRLADLFPDHRPEARRSFRHLLTMIEALALLHIRRRTRDSEGRIVATRDDYSAARRLLAAPMTKALGKAMSGGASRLYTRLQTWVDGEFTTPDVYQHEDFCPRQLRDWLMELRQAGFLKLVVEGARGREYTYELSGNPPDLKAISLLPTMDQLFPIATE